MPSPNRKHSHSGTDQEQAAKLFADIANRTSQAAGKALTFLMAADELIRVSTVHNSFVGIDHLSDEEIEEIRSKCVRRAKAGRAGEENTPSTSDAENLEILAEGRALA